MRLMVLLLMVMLPLTALAEDKVLNIYTWPAEIPDAVARQFEKETGIKVNLSTYENNEMLYAKLRAEKNAGYDVIVPTSYYVDRMRRQDLLEKIDKSKLPNLKNLDPLFLHPDYDTQLNYSVPHIWGVTGIFLNTHYYQPASVTKWNDLWQARFNNQLMLLDDVREVFSIALLSLGYSANDNQPEHIKAAYLKLKTLMKNVKVFSTETVISIIIDEDATIGSAWNGDTYKAALENKAVTFIFPQDGFVIWVDNLCIPKNAPHKDNAYAFINFMLRAEIEKEVTLFTHFPTTNGAAQALLPKAVRNNPIIYPPKAVMKRGQFQTDLDEKTLALYEHYWEALKMGA